MSNRPTDADEIAAALACPFAPGEVKFRAGATNRDGTKALALAYVTARVVQDRLDEVMGIDGWQATFREGAGGSVVCVLALKIGGEWIAKEDVGGESEQPDEGDRRKAAFSDAFKRAAVQWGVGRFLYSLPQSWVAFDKQRKQLAEKPAMPQQPVKAAPAKKKTAAPKTGAELLDRLTRKDADLHARDLAPAGGLVDHVQAALDAAGFGKDVRRWQGPALDVATEEAARYIRCAERSLVWPAQALELATRIENEGVDVAKAEKALGVSLLELPRSRYAEVLEAIRKGDCPGGQSAA